MRSRNDAVQECVGLRCIAGSRAPDQSEDSVSCANYVLNASEEDLVGSLAVEFTLDTPVFDEARIVSLTFW